MLSKLDKITIKTTNKLDVQTNQIIENIYKKYVENKKEVKNLLCSVNAIYPDAFESVKKDISICADYYFKSSNDYRLQKKSSYGKSGVHSVFEETIIGLINSSLMIELETLHEIEKIIENKYSTNLKKEYYHNNLFKKLYNIQNIMNIDIVELDVFLDYLVGDIPNLDKFADIEAISKFKEKSSYQYDRVSIKKDSIEIQNAIYFSSWHANYIENNSPIYSILWTINYFLNKKGYNAYNFCVSINNNKINYDWYDCGQVMVKIFKNRKVIIRFKDIELFSDFVEFFEL